MLNRLSLTWLMHKLDLAHPSTCHYAISLKILTFLSFCHYVHSVQLHIFYCRQQLLCIRIIKLGWTSWCTYYQLSHSLCLTSMWPNSQWKFSHVVNFLLHIGKRWEPGTDAATKSAHVCLRVNNYSVLTIFSELKNANIWLIFYFNWYMLYTTDNHVN